MSKPFDVGDVALLIGRLTHPTTGAPVAPATVIVTVRKPDGTTATPDVADSGFVDPKTEREIEAGDGVYQARQPLDQKGEWRYAVDAYDSEDEPIAAAEHKLVVRRRYVTVDPPGSS